MQAESEKKTEMVADPKRVKMVKVRAKRDFTLPNGTTVLPGKEVEVTEEEAEVLTRVHQGAYSFSGERENGDATRHQIQKAERVV